MDESQQNTLRERSHPHTQKNYTLYDSIYMMFWQKQKCSKRKQMVGARSRGSGRGLTPEGQWRSLGGVMKLFYILIGMLVTQLWTFVKPC